MALTTLKAHDHTFEIISRAGLRGGAGETVDVPWLVPNRHGVHDKLSVDVALCCIDVIYLTTGSAMSDADTTLQDLRERIAVFVHERDWEQFHTPKDLASAISIEAAELMELFLWRSAAEVEAVAAGPETGQKVQDELADVLILCLSLANRLEIDVADAVARKIESNRAKYPADKVRGRAEKYTYYREDRPDA